MKPNTPQQILQEAREEFEKKFGFSDSVYGDNMAEAILSWHASTLQAFIEAEIERLVEMKGELSKRCDDYSEKLDEKICFDDGFSEAIDDQITHLKELKH